MHARKTRKRKKVQMESIQHTIETLQEEVRAVLAPRGGFESPRSRCLHVDRALGDLACHA